MFTYFILDAFNKAVKIGRSKNPDKRLRQLQTSSAHELKLLLVLEGDHEKAIHKVWASHRLKGEWFRADDDLLVYVYARTENSHQLKFKGSRLFAKHSWETYPKPLDNIPYKRHIRILENAYTDYRLQALSLMASPGLLVNQIMTDCPSGKGVPKMLHARVLADARQVYCDSSLEYLVTAPRLVLQTGAPAPILIH